MINNWLDYFTRGWNVLNSSWTTYIFNSPTIEVGATTEPPALQVLCLLLKPMTGIKIMYYYHQVFSSNQLCGSFVLWEVTVCTVALNDAESQSPAWGKPVCLQTRQNSRSQTFNWRSGCCTFTFLEVDQGFLNFISQVVTWNFYLVDRLLPLWWVFFKVV